MVLVADTVGSCEDNVIILLLFQDHIEGKGEDRATLYSLSLVDTSTELASADLRRLIDSIE